MSDRSKTMTNYPTTTLNPSDFTEEHPSSRGVYLWLNSLGLALITVVWYEPESFGGVQFDGYWGITEHRGRNVTKLKGKFMKLECYDNSDRFFPE